MSDERRSGTRRLRWGITVAAGLLATVAMLLRLHSLGPRLELASYLLSPAPTGALFMVQITVRGGETVERIEVVPGTDETVMGRTAVEDFSSGSVWSARVLVPRAASGRADGSVTVRMVGPVEREYHHELWDGRPDDEGEPR